MSTPEDRLAQLEARLRQQRIRAELAKMREPPGFIERGVGLARQGLAGIGDMIGTTTVGAMRAVGESPLLRPGLQDDLLEGRVTAPDEGGNVLTRGADALQGEYESFREDTAPDGMGETVARVVGRLLGEGAKYMAGGAAIRGAAGRLTGASRVPTPVLPTMRGRAAQGLQEAAKDAAAVLPLDVATTAYGPEESVLGAAADLTGNETLRDLSENRAARLAAEVGTGFGMDVAIRGLAGGVKAGARGVREATDLVGDLSPAIREGLEGADRPVIVPDRPVSEAPAPRVVDEVVPEPAAIEAEAPVASVDAPTPEPEVPAAAVPEPEVVRPEVEPQAIGPEPDFSDPPSGALERVRVTPEAPRVEATEAARLAPDERGFALPALTRTLAGAGVGATGGALVDDEKPLRGALIGSMVGAGAANIKAFVESDLYRRVVDQTQPIVDLGYKLGGGSKLRDELSAFRGFRGAAAQMIRGDNGLGGVIKQINAKDFTPAPVTPARNAVRGSLSLDGLTKAEAEVAELMTAQRAIELAGRGITDKVPFSVEQAQEVVALLQPKVGAQADALRAYYSELLDMRLKAGVITQSDYDAIKAANEFYTPFTRDFGDEALPQRGEKGRDGRALSGKKGVRRIEEGVATSPIMDPFTQAVEDTNETFRRVGKQRVTNLVAQLVEENPEAAAPFLRRVPNNSEPSRNAKIVQANVNGQRQSFEVLDEDLYEAWAGMDEYIGNIAIRIMAVPRKVLRETVTILPDFAIANAIRDNMMSVVQYPLPVRGAAAGTAIGAAGGAATAEEGERGAGALRGAALGLGAGSVTPQLARMVGAMKNIIKDDAIYEQFVKEGGVGSGFYVRNATDARRVVNQLRKGGFNATDVINPVSYWNALQAINRVVEEAPRLARYKYGQGVGVLGSAATDATRAAARETAAESIFGARDISLDFARMGADMKGWNAMVAFQNAKIQGYDKLARMANLKTAGVGLAAITAPTIALWTINSEDPEYWDVPLWERNLFWLIPKSAEARARGEGAFWKIPKPFEVGFIFASLPERILDFTKQKDPESLRAALADMTSTYGQMQGIPTAAVPVIEGVADYSFFRGRALNPEQYANIPPEFQFDNRTSSVAVEAGQRLGVSPAKIDNALRGYFGSFGNEVNQVLTKVARMTGVDERPEPPTGRTPLLGRFSTQDATAGELEQSVRRKFRKADAARTMVRRMLEDGDVEGAREYARERADVLRDYNQLKAYNDALGDVSRARRAITNAPGLSADEKARRLAEINRRVSERLSNLNR